VVFAASEALSFVVVSFAYRTVMPLPRVEDPVKVCAAAAIMTISCFSHFAVSSLTPLEDLVLFGLGGLLAYAIGLWATGLVSSLRRQSEVVVS
jgi:hypothetical protein